MSQREGHEWNRIDEGTRCEGKNNTCQNLAEWEKILYACDKSCYRGGCFCETCAVEEEDMFVSEVSKPNPMISSKLDLTQLTIDDIVNAMRINGVRIITIDSSSGRSPTSPYQAWVQEWYGAITRIQE